MDEVTKELIAIGASVAVNCRPCLAFHWRKGKAAGITQDQALAAAEVGMMVNRGAANETKAYVGEEITGERADQAAREGCGCG